MKYQQKIADAEGASFHVLDPEKAARMNGKTLYIPSVEDVRNAIDAIPFGSTKSIIELRQDLAKRGKADVACPAKTIKYWKWLAFAAEEEKWRSYCLVESSQGWKTK